MPTLQNVSLFLKSRLGRSAGQIPSPNLILELPVEILHVIANQLSVRDLLLLSRVCKSFHAVFHPRLLLDKRHASKEEYLELLYLLASEQPHRWACQSCLILHRVNYQDHPIHSSASTTSCKYVVTKNANLRSGQYALHHHHVQLGLKLSRLRRITDADEDYLSHLLRGCTAYHSESTYHMTRTITPKIVRGRWLQKTQWDFKVVDKSFVLTPRFTLSLLSPCCPNLDDDPRSTTSGFVHAIYCARNNLGRARIYACPHCAAEFEVRFTADSQHVSMLMYQNLGTEGAMPDLYWTALTTGSDQDDIDGGIVTLNQDSSEAPRELWGDSRPWFSRHSPGH
ncbi:hypothetical protein NLG97_g7405 [Lecanicillium saksenae]|uniref:Uncharacterized protein n=1 Tax=Lecanicillium saksenae TaxID=468837 RepID=A0ACC1QQQ2_9HYPO|nr:hypothetical protein NLG97_g7405 [Lecanicillium saksenae]